MVPAGRERRADSHPQWDNTLLARTVCSPILSVHACVCARTMARLEIAYFEQVLVKILAIIQPFQVANELRT